MRTSLIASIPFLFLLSCSSRNQPVLDEDRFLEAYVSILEHRSAAAAVDKTSDSSSVHAVLDSLGITVNEFSATVEDYNRDIRRWQAFYTQVLKRLEEREKQRADTTL